jgi:hypothetical protein
MTEQVMPRARSLTEFQASFPDEAGCAAFLRERRWPEGFACTDQRRWVVSRRCAKSGRSLSFKRQPVHLQER